MKNKIKIYNKKQSDATFHLLFDAAKKYLPRAHSPYSQIKVACAVLTEDNKIFGGCNVENASYGATICAERVAIMKAVSEVEGAIKIKAIFVITNQNKIWPPCGICRQVISEFSQKSTVVYCGDLKKNYIKIKFSELFPGAFTADHLKSSRI